MSTINSISVDKLARLIGTPHCPALIDVRTEDDFNSSPRLIPGSIRCPRADSSEWAREFVGRSVIVRGADTGRMDIAPQAAGLLAISLGLSRMYADDLAQLEAGLTLYDAFYRWCRDATEETHATHSRKPGA